MFENKTRDFSNILLIGAGTMGRGIAQLLAKNGDIKSVQWLARNRGDLDLKSQLNDYLKPLVQKKRISDEDAICAIQKFTFCNTISEVVKSPNIVIEAVTENYKNKEKVIQDVNCLTDEKLMIFTNTSSLSVTRLSMMSKDPARFLGLHFFNPVTQMRLVEIVAGVATDQETVDFAVEFSKLLGKEPVCVRECPGFVVNRLLMPMINEAAGILAEGVATAREIDSAMKHGANHPMGPLELADLIGIDVCVAILDSIQEQTGDPKYRTHYYLKQLVSARRLGKKTGIGFYQY